MTLFIFTMTAWIYVSAQAWHEIFAHYLHPSSSNSPHPSPLILSILRCHVNMSKANNMHESQIIFIFHFHIMYLIFLEVTLFQMDPTLACCVIYKSCRCLISGCWRWMWSGCSSEAHTKRGEDRADISQVTLLSPHWCKSGIRPSDWLIPLTSVRALVPRATQKEK